MKTYSIEELFDIDKESNDERVCKLADVKKLLQQIDVAFEMVRINVQIDNPQAIAAVNEAWEEVRAMEPWKRDTNSGQIIEEGTGKTIALIPYFDKEDEQLKANAQLIASAPELLEALKKAKGYVQFALDECNRIANENNTEDTGAAKRAMFLIDEIETAIAKATEGQTV